MAGSFSASRLWIRLKNGDNVYLQELLTTAAHEAIHARQFIMLGPIYRLVASSNIMLRLSPGTGLARFLLELHANTIAKGRGFNTAFEAAWTGVWSNPRLRVAVLSDGGWILTGSGWGAWRTWLWLHGKDAEQ